MAKASNKGGSSKAANKKAYHDYLIIDKYEAGISLLGTEVKSIRAGQINLRDSFVGFSNGEAYLENAHISAYSHGNWTNHNPTRKRKLLLHASEIKKLEKAVETKGITVVALKLYEKRGIFKLEIATAKGKKLYDKRQTLKAKQDERDKERAFKDANR
ncbi:MAG: SsrA-binding protein SmpB [Bifidobacteriaceae bacterium]|jgi:SsrA-binding protein|nr:SsrA-binding protein SmpB [Bifidobacteriaceae bacterium]